jgi:hypothetical protein
MSTWVVKSFKAGAETLISSFRDRILSPSLETFRSFTDHYQCYKAFHITKKRSRSLFLMHMDTKTMMFFECRPTISTFITKGNSMPIRFNR